MTSSVSRPRTFLDIQLGTLPAGRVVIELFIDKTPKTCENFRSLCTSSFTPLGASKPLTYKLSPIHRVIDDFMIQGGDITSGDGTGGQSIYGGTFADENIGWRETDTAGLVCMANRGKGTNSSQFFITLAPCPHLNAKHTIFGHVVAGLDAIDRIAKVEVDRSDRPIQDILITHCGELEQRKKPTAAQSSVSTIKSGDNKHPGTLKRGRKRMQSSHSPRWSASRSHSGSAAGRPENRRKYHKQSPLPEAGPGRRRSDIEIDETRRGRARTRSPSAGSSNRNGPLKERHADRKRNLSPSRSRSRPRSPSPHLRRRHTRSRDRSPVSRGPRNRHNYHSQRRDESWIRKEEQEREGGEDRYHGVIEDEYSRNRRRPADYYRQEGQVRCHNGGGRFGGGGGGGENDAGEVKFKGRGSMKYREKKR